MKIINIFLALILLGGCTSVDKKTETLDNNDELNITPDNRVNITSFNQEFETEEASNLNSEAIINAQAGKYKEAESILLESLLIEKENPVLLSNLGLVYNGLQDYEGAVKYFEKSMQVSDSNYVAAAANLGMTYYQHNEFLKSIAISEYVVSKSDDQSVVGSACINLTASYLALKDCDNASKHLVNLKQIFKDVEGLKDQIVLLESKIDILCSK